MVSKSYQEEYDDIVVDIMNQFNSIKNKFDYTGVEYIRNSECSDITIKRVKNGYIKGRNRPSNKSLNAVCRGIIQTVGVDALELFAGVIANFVLAVLVGFASVKVYDIDYKNHSFKIEVKPISNE